MKRIQLILVHAITIAFLGGSMLISCCSPGKSVQKPQPRSSPRVEPSAPANASTRTIQFVNNCSQTIWIGALGTPLPVNGGFELAAGATKDILVADNLISGRFWARTGCKLNGSGVLVCETGDCVGKGINCDGISGQAPATLAELTLNDANGLDFYDISLVDGYNIGLSIEPFGNVQKVNNDNLGKFNCGSPNCPVMDYTKCPPELLLQNSSGQTIGCLSVCAAVNNTEQLKKFNNILGGYDKNLVCCSCACGPDCGCTDPKCKFGCSPFNNDPKEVGGKCRVEDWPRASNGMRYDSVFKSQAPDAYSWQFNDGESTYQCSKANYRITFRDK
ncbi:MAG: thaumatin family protein [Saprospiraceae bacterium]